MRPFLPSASPRVVHLATGADVRLRNEGARLAVVLLNGGSAKPVAGTWSATSELLARELALRFPDVAFAEVRYRLKTWKELDSCMADAREAIDQVERGGARRVALVGFSMGGAVSIGVAGDEAVAGVIGLAPWIPPQLRVDGLRGKRFDVVHGAWDRYVPGIPGVNPSHSRAAFDRVRGAGVAGTYRLIARGLHGAAVRRRDGTLVRLPRWQSWVAETAAALARYETA